MKRIEPTALFSILTCLMIFGACAPRPYLSTHITQPKLTNNPSKDVVVTTLRPLLSFFNSKGGIGGRSYTIQIDRVPTFDSENLIEYLRIPETPFVTSKRIEEKDALEDRRIYYWRVKAEDRKGKKSIWTLSRFIVDVTSDDACTHLTRTAVQGVKASSGSGVHNITELGDDASNTFWAGSSDSKEHWIQFDFGKLTAISRIWELFNKVKLNGRPKEYAWHYSHNGTDWQNAAEANMRNSDAFRRVVNFKQAITARFFRLDITGWYGDFPKIYEITFYSASDGALIEAPDKDYVLLIDNGHTGSTTGDLNRTILTAVSRIKTVTVPYQEISLEKVSRLDPKPKAIILSDFKRRYENLPMFEFNGEYEVIRSCDIPLLGIGRGCHLMAMAAGYSYVRNSGQTSTAYKAEQINVTILKNDPIFNGISENFYAVDNQKWEIALLPDTTEKLAVSSNDTAAVIKIRDKTAYGFQFNPEAQYQTPQGVRLLHNFLTMALSAHP